MSPSQEVVSTSWRTSATGSVTWRLEATGLEHVGLEVPARAGGDADGADRGVAVVDEPLVDPGGADDEPAGGRLVTVGVGGDVLVRAVVERVAVVADALAEPRGGPGRHRRREHR